MPEATEKKKRGRPKKVDSYAEFKPIIINTFTGYVDKYKDLLESFANNESRLNKKDWTEIYDHVKYITSCIEKEYPEYNYKLDSQWKLIDTVHEKTRKEAIKDFLLHDEIPDYLKGWLIFGNLSVYIAETSKEMK